MVSECKSVNTPEITLVLPRILAQLTQGERRFKARGATIRDALEDLGRTRPGLQIHFFDDAGRVRKYIICIHGEDFVRAPDLGSQIVFAGDEVQIVNALAGG